MNRPVEFVIIVLCLLAALFLALTALDRCNRCGRGEAAYCIEEYDIHNMDGGDR